MKPGTYMNPMAVHPAATAAGVGGSGVATGGAGVV